MGQITVGPNYTGPYYSGPNYSRAKLPMGQITVGLKTGPSFSPKQIHIQNVNQRPFFSH